MSGPLAPPLTRAQGATLLLVSWLFAGCGRMGYEMLPEEREDTLGGNGGAPSDLDASTGVGGAGTTSNGSSRSTAGAASDPSAGGVSGAGGSGAGGTFGAGSSATDSGAPGSRGMAAAGGAEGGTSDGGAVGAGGSAASGGASGAGGATGAGGASGTGGATGAGGASGTGGATGAGGTTGAGGGGACTVTNGGVEICDGVDNDCNGTADDGGACDVACTGYTYGGHAYAFCDTPSTYANAEASCQVQGMHLVRVDDSAENDFVYTTAFAAVAPAYNGPDVWRWLGGYSTASPVEWVFPDGTVFWSGRQSGTPVGGLWSTWDASSPSDATGTYGVVLQHTVSRLWHTLPRTRLLLYVCEAY